MTIIATQNLAILSKVMLQSCSPPTDNYNCQGHIIIGYTFVVSIKADNVS